MIKITNTHVNMQFSDSDTCKLKENNEVDDVDTWTQISSQIQSELNLIHVSEDGDKGSIKSHLYIFILIVLSYYCTYLILHITVCGQLLYLIPRLLPEARRASIAASSPVSEYQEENLPGLWSSATDTSSTWSKTAWHLWRHPAFSQLGDIPQYQVT